MPLARFPNLTKCRWRGFRTSRMPLARFPNLANAAGEVSEPRECRWRGFRTSPYLSKPMRAAFAKQGQRNSEFSHLPLAQSRSAILDFDDDRRQYSTPPLPLPISYTQRVAFYQPDNISWVPKLRIFNSFRPGVAV